VAVDYIDYAFYVDPYRGKLEEEEFYRYAVHAAAYLDTVTHGRITEELSQRDIERVKLALCAVTDIYATEAKIGNIASETNDGVSVSYRTGTEEKTTSRQAWEAAVRFLGNTGLLYRGVM
jgi:hypothetical protein